MKHWKRAVLAAILLFLVALCVTRCWRFQQWIGKGEFVTYEAADRSRLQTEDRVLYELLPSQAGDIRIWKFRFCGYWGGRYRIEKSLLEAWAKENNLSRYQDPAPIETYDTKTSQRFIDTSNGIIYRTVKWKNERMLASEYLLYYDNAEGVAYFTLSIE